MDKEVLAIQTIGLTKRFWQRTGFFKKRRITAVDNVDLEVKRGEIFGLLGQNGAGKTTLIKMLCNLVLPDQGRALINGRIITETTKITPSLGVVISDVRGFHWRLTGRQNLEFFGILNNLYGKTLHKRIEETLWLMGLNDVADIWFKNYSSGMRQRLSIAKGIMHNPDIIFLDEPTRGLDPLVAKELRDFVKNDLNKKHGKTIFICTHQISEAQDLCDKVAIMHQGKIKITGKTHELASQAGSLYQLFVNTVRGQE